MPFSENTDSRPESIVSSGSIPGPHSTYHLTSGTSPVTIHISYRRCSPTIAAHHIATHSDRVCPYRRRRQQPYSPLYRVRGTWRQSIGPIVSAGLRPNYPPGALGSRPGWVAPSTQTCERRL
ncbi:hypothetical protein TIFTF001_012056 [Ficus carica]|uniref:Uncharacterized protein n=1 Tax=Ficus carica TaxID=3494 RepID=A0AA87ZYC6_FICCA|nr:hypothetical protein TIFTF001_012056 [Ficus carica]